VGIFQTIFKRPAEQDKLKSYYEMLTAYKPVYTSFSGGIYEMALTRAAVNAFATHVSKLKPEIAGAVGQTLQTMLEYRPNPWMDTTRFLYRLATIYAVSNNAFILPIYDDYMTLTGLFPANPQQCEILEYQGEPWVKYTFSNGRVGAVEMARVGILTQYQYQDDFFGSSNAAALDPIMQVISTQNQGIIEAVKSSATVRFLGQVLQTLKDKTMADIRKQFVEDNFSSENSNGVVLYDGRFGKMEPITSKPIYMDAEQTEVINKSVYTFFGVNEKILMNNFSESEWDAFYEGKIEPFAVHLSLTLTNMMYSNRQIAFGNKIFFSSNRLQYASNATKLNIVTQMFDRGFITHNQGLEIFNMAQVPDGDKRYIRKEYAEVGKLLEDKGGKANEPDGNPAPDQGIPVDGAPAPDPAAATAAN